MGLGSGIPDPGVKKAPDPGSRIRNTGYFIYSEKPDILSRGLEASTEGWQSFTGGPENKLQFFHKVLHF